MVCSPRDLKEMENMSRGPLQNIYQPRYIPNRSGNQLRDSLPSDKRNLQKLLRSTDKKHGFQAKGLWTKDHLDKSDKKNLQDSRVGGRERINRKKVFTEQGSLNNDYDRSYTANLDLNQDRRQTLRSTGMDELGRTVHPKDLIEQSINHSYPAQSFEFEAEHLNEFPSRYSSRELETTLESNRELDTTQSFEYMSTESPSRSHIDNLIDYDNGNRKGSDDFETQIPEWAQYVLSKRISLSSRFKKIKDSISKWSLRDRHKFRPSVSGNRTAVIFDLDGNPVTPIKASFAVDVRQEFAESTTKRKTNGVAVFLLGLFLVILFVFPVVVIIFVYADKSNFAQIELHMTFNSSMAQDLNTSVMTYNICKETDVAFSSYGSFYACDVLSFTNGSIGATVLLVFKVDNFPPNIIAKDIINSHFSSLPDIDGYLFIPSLTAIIEYRFYDDRDDRLIGRFSYRRDT